MARRETRSRAAWEDRFRTPTAAELLAGFNRQQAQLIEYARGLLRDRESLREEILWTGVPWRWTFAFRADGDTERPRVYVIPQPAKPQLAAPLPTEAIASLDLRRTPRFIRDALVFAPQVGAVRWPHWDVTNRSQVEEVVSLLRTAWEPSAGLTV